MTTASSEVNSLVDTAESNIDSVSFRHMIEGEFGIVGETPKERVEHLKELSVEGLAIMLESINKAVQGVEDSQLSHDKTIKIGDKSTVSPKHRYEVFRKLIEKIKTTDESVNPARIADTLALGVVLLHPFNDGNGRTARTIGLIFRDNYDQPDFSDDFNQVSESRDKLREKSGWMINGYIPKIEGDQSDPDTVNAYLANLLTDEAKGAYISCYGYEVAPLHSVETPAANIFEASEDAILESYQDFKDDIVTLLKQIENGGAQDAYLGSGSHSDVYTIRHNDKTYAVRMQKPSGRKVEITNSHVVSGAKAKNLTGLEQIVSASYEDGVIISEYVPGTHVGDLVLDQINNMPNGHLQALLQNRKAAMEAGIQFDSHPDNIIYDEVNGFTDIDYHALKELPGEVTRVDAMKTIIGSLDLTETHLYEEDEIKSRVYEGKKIALWKRVTTYIEGEFTKDEYDEIWTELVSKVNARQVGHTLSRKKAHPN